MSQGLLFLGLLVVPVVDRPIWGNGLAQQNFEIDNVIIAMGPIWSTGGLELTDFHDWLRWGGLNERVGQRRRGLEARRFIAAVRSLLPTVLQCEP